jgi:uncharacterized tellurite resistance protein B-like protein
MTTDEQSMELESLGFIVKRRYDIDAEELDNLINLLKMQLYRDYKDTYNGD